MDFACAKEDGIWSVKYTVCLLWKGDKFKVQGSLVSFSTLNNNLLSRSEYIPNSTY